MIAQIKGDYTDFGVRAIIFSIRVIFLNLCNHFTEVKNG